MALRRDEGGYAAEKHSAQQHSSTQEAKNECGGDACRRHCYTDTSCAAELSLQPGYLRRSQVSAGPSASGAASAASSSPVSTAPPNAMDGSGKNAGAPSSR
jgi:hypothetical protein